MNREIINGREIKIEDEEVLRQTKMMEHVDDEDYADDIARVLEMSKEASKVAYPKALIDVLPIEDRGESYVKVPGATYESKLVAEKLEHQNRVIAYVVTCGSELEQWSKSFSDPLEQYWADGIKLLYLGKMMGLFHSVVKEKYFSGKDMSSLNPGSLIDWPLSQQKELFASLGDVKGDIGVELTESCLMLPSKSGSGLLFSSATGEHYENCATCPIEDCPNRRAPMQVEPRK